MDLVQAAQKLTQYLGETEDDYQMAEHGAQLAPLVRGAGEAISYPLPETDVTDLYYSFGEVSDATRAAQWSHIPAANDQFERNTQAAIHAYAAELNRILNYHGFRGTILADRLDDILEPRQLADH